MEQSEGYKSVQANIKDQLSLCDIANQKCKLSAREAEKDIEEHFAKCINDLAERKATLLRQVSHKTIQQEQYIEASRAELERSLHACNKSLDAASLVYSVDCSSAEILWKGLLAVPVSNVACLQIITKLPKVLPNSIQQHGKVEYSSHFLKAERVTTFAGRANWGNVNAKGANAILDSPWGICLNSQDESLYLCDFLNNAIKKVNMKGTVSTFVTGDNNIRELCEIAINYRDSMFFVSSYYMHSISKITAEGCVIFSIETLICGLGTITVVAGSGSAGYSEGIGNMARFNQPTGIAINQQTGTLFVGDCNNHIIRKITPQGEVSTLAGQPSRSGFADGTGNAALFNKPWGLLFNEEDKSLVVCDNSNNKLRRVAADGTVSTVCEIPSPHSVVLTASKTILVSSGSNQLFKVAHQGAQRYKVEVLAGSGRDGNEDGEAKQSSFRNMFGIAVHEESHSCFVPNYHSIRKISFANEIV